MKPTSNTTERPLAHPGSVARLAQHARGTQPCSLGHSPPIADVSDGQSVVVRHLHVQFSWTLTYFVHVALHWSESTLLPQDSTVPRGALLDERGISGVSVNATTASHHPFGSSSDVQPHSYFDHGAICAGHRSRAKPIRARWGYARRSHGEIRPLS
eukprot:4372625-Prymnesium_polylepis.2